MWAGIFVAVVGGSGLALVKWGAPAIARTVVQAIGDQLKTRWVRAIEQATKEVVEHEVVPLREELHAMCSRLGAIEEQLTPNGGTTDTLGDTIVRIEQAVLPDDDPPPGGTTPRRR